MSGRLGWQIDIPSHCCIRQKCQLGRETGLGGRRGQIAELGRVGLAVRIVGLFLKAYRYPD